MNVLDKFCEVKKVQATLNQNSEGIPDLLTLPAFIRNCYLYVLYKKRMEELWKNVLKNLELFSARSNGDKERHFEKLEPLKNFFLESRSTLLRSYSF